MKSKRKLPTRQSIVPGFHNTASQLTKIKIGLKSTGSIWPACEEIKWFSTNKLRHSHNDMPIIEVIKP